MLEKSITFLLENANPSIKRRVKSEILHDLAQEEAAKMTKDLKEVIDYFLADASDPFPRYILRKEILRETPSGSEYKAIKTSKWYQQLAVEQWENGSWGRFHTQDTKMAIKQKFVTTEHALRRARELSLGKDDAVIQRAIGLMERYIRGEEVWPDTMEKHYGFEIAFKTLVAANLSLFDPQNPLLRTKREICAHNLSKAFAGGMLDEDVWESENRKSNDILLRAWMVYPIWLLQNNEFLSEDLQRQFLSWIWDRKGGIYYINNLPPSDKRSLEDKDFILWLAGLENLCKFSLFPEFMNQSISGHLLNEIKRLMTDDVKLPPAHPISGHYSEKWANGSARKNDMILRMSRVLVKC
ncbi:MAG: hypothetical protein ABFD25_09390 [Clostridiaceae bacterium]